ncbi:CopG-like DNA-binding domain protein [Candidatus Magnetomorum sp. HK-1]|nr:CopG-like DNA-binding domain protein [Candidatus Magnetomorum sp. HK-1]
MSTNDSNNESKDYVQMKIEVTDEELDLLKKKSEEKGITISELVNQILEEFIANHNIDDLIQEK